MEAPKNIDSHSLSVGEILRKPHSYKVPYYQRDFSWTKEEVGVLWEDITNSLMENSDAEYFMGVVVTSPTDNDKLRYIVDGQQRLATLAMVFSAIALEWNIRNDEKRSSGVYRDFLGSEDRRTGEIIPKLKLNETNDTVYYDLILQNNECSSTNRKAWPKTNSLIYEAYDLIKKNLNEWLNEFQDHESALLDLEEYIANKLNFIEIKVSGDSDAFTIFETLNDRGLNLAVADLVKNYLFSLAGPYLEKFKQSWSEISMLVGKENITQFLRHYWLAFYELVRERDLYRAIKKEIRNKTKALQFLNGVRNSAEHYAALSNPQHAYWTDFDFNVSNTLEALLLFKVTQFRPVALAAMHTLDPDKIQKVLYDLMVLSFRYTVISASGTGNLEKAYCDTALSITNRKADTPQKIFNGLKKVYIDDSIFCDNFIQRKITKPNIARHILAKINDHLEGNAEKCVAEETGKITLEHILPQNPNELWNDSYSSQEELIEFVDTVGNLTLLERGRNKGIKNMNFSDKIAKAFSQSTLALNKELCSLKKWDIKKIKERSKNLSRIAADIWKIQF